MPVDDEVRAAAKRRGQQMNASAWYKLRGGQGEAIDNTFRILPTPPTKKHKFPWIEYGLHREVGPNKRTVRCGKDPVTGEGSCYMCDIYIPKLRKQGRDATATALEPRAVFLVQVASVRVNDDESLSFSGPFLFTPSKGVAASLLQDVFSGGRGKRDYLDPKKGFNITIPRTGTGKNDTKYGIMQADAEASAVPSSIIKKLKPFEELTEIPLYSEAKQKAALQGIEVPEGADDDEELAPKASKRSRDDDDDADDGDDDDDARPGASDDDDDDDEPAPKKKGKKAPEPDDDDEPAPKKGKGKKAPEPDDDDDSDSDDDDDAGDDDEDDEPAPPKKGKKAPEPEDDDGDDDDGDSDDGDDDDSDDEPEPPKKKGKKAPEPEDDDDDDDDGDSDDGDDDDDGLPPPPRRVAPPPSKKPGKKKK